MLLLIEDPFPVTRLLGCYASSLVRNRFLPLFPLTALSRTPFSTTAQESGNRNSAWNYRKIGGLHKVSKAIRIEGQESKIMRTHKQAGATANSWDQLQSSSSSLVPQKPKSQPTGFLLGFAERLEVYTWFTRLQEQESKRRRSPDHIRKLGLQQPLGPKSNLPLKH